VRGRRGAVPAASRRSTHSSRAIIGLLKSVDPSLLLATSSGTLGLTPDGKLALQQLIVQARANPASAGDHSGPVAKVPQGPR
jgi:hypothetical protein